MLRGTKLTGKIVATIVVTLIVTSTASFWITQHRVNQQEQDAFRDKVRQITGMANATRGWFSDNLPFIVPDRNFKHLQQVPVVVAWSVAQHYADAQKMTFHTPSLAPRDPKNQPDDFDRRALENFQKDLSLKEYSELRTENGEEVMRYAQPVRLTADCLVCHGDPVGQKDPFGYSKEGMKAGDLRAVFTVKASTAMLAETSRANSIAIFLISLLTLLAAAVVMFALVRKLVVTPLSASVHLANAIAENNLKVLVFKDPRSVDWSAQLTPTDAPKFDSTPVNLPEALQAARDNRPELRRLRLQNEINDIDVQFFKNQTKPRIDLVGTVALTGLAGTDVSDAPIVNPGLVPLIIGDPATSQTAFLLSQIRAIQLAQGLPLAEVPQVQQEPPPAPKPAVAAVAPPPPPPAAAPQAANSPLGVWLTEEKEGKVRIEECGSNLCGYAVDKKSNQNGEQVLINMKPGKDKWSGRIFDPNSGSTYDSTIALKGTDNLRVQGCAFGGMFCGGQTWTRVN